MVDIITFYKYFMAQAIIQYSKYTLLKNKELLMKYLDIEIGM